jgi:hypothetical protein
MRPPHNEQLETNDYIVKTKKIIQIMFEEKEKKTNTTFFDNETDEI